MKKAIRPEAVDQLFDAILQLRDRDECRSFFRDICTTGELSSLSQRFDVGIQLMNKKTYQEIAAITGASTVTISRVNRLLYEGNTGMEMAAKRINLVPSDDSENS